MLARISCPACQNQFSIPEGEMGTRQVCGKCHSPFIAGKAIMEPQLAGHAAAGAPAFNKTMLGNTSPAIKYNCPRCQAPLEAMAIEAGTKKACPACSQRIQVPAAPPQPAAQAPQAALNKTMLADDGRAPAAPPIKYNCPSCRKPLESPASEAGIKKPCPACGQRLQIPASSAGTVQPNPNKTMLASDNSSPQQYGQASYATPTAVGAAASAPAKPPAGGITIGSHTIPVWQVAVAAVALVMFLIIVVPAVVRGGKTEDVEAAAAQKKELERASVDVERWKAELESKQRFEAEIREKINTMVANQQAEEQRTRDTNRELLHSLTDEKQRAEMQEKIRDDQRRHDQEKLEADKAQQKMLADAKAAADASKAALEAAQAKQQTIIQQPPPVYYYPPYSWHYYYPW